MFRFGLIKFYPMSHNNFYIIGLVNFCWVMKICMSFIFVVPLSHLDKTYKIQNIQSNPSLKIVSSYLFTDDTRRLE